MNIHVCDEDQEIQILTGLPPQHDSLVHTLKYWNGKETLTVKEVTSSAYAKEAELRETCLAGMSRLSDEGVVVTRRRADKRGKSYGKNRSKSKDHRSKLRPKNDAKSKECWACGKEGHFKRDCPNRKDKPYETANTTQEKEHPMILTASVQATKDE